jgi:phosphoglycolate phosphatase
VKKPAVLLFDVDGTLLITRGATTRCIWQAAETTMGRDLPRMPLTSGRLDQQLFSDVLANAQITDSATYLDRYKSIYLQLIDAELSAKRDQIIVMPGVPALLQQLASRDEVIVGLLTGNFRESTTAKLKYAGIDASVFKIGAFAEDAQDRPGLVAAAIDQVADRYGERPAPSQLIIIGDTPRDIAAARQAGTRVLSVATGTYTLEQLRAEHPDAAVMTLEDTQPLEGLIELAHHSRHI